MAKQKIRIEILPGGARALMTSPEIVATLEACADRALDALPKGYKKNVYPRGRTRANVSVYTSSHDAQRDNAKNNSLLKALGGAAK